MIRLNISLPAMSLMQVRQRLRALIEAVAMHMQLLLQDLIAVAQMVFLAVTVLLVVFRVPVPVVRWRRIRLIRVMTVRVLRQRLLVRRSAEALWLAQA